MVCKVKLMANPNWGGSSVTIDGTSKTNIGQWASAANVTADNENCVVAAYTCNNYNAGSGCDQFIMRDRQTALARKESDSAYKAHYGVTGRGWNDSIASVKAYNIPTANSNQLEYILNAPSQRFYNGANPALIGTREIKDFDGTKYRPCPGGTAYFNSRSGVKCIYSKTDADGISVLHNTNNKRQQQPQMLTYLKREFCKVPDNAFKNPGGGTCYESGAGAQIAKEYCSIGDRIATDTNCTEGALSTNYASVAEAFCKSASGKRNQFCSCYNVINGVCDSDGNAAGCAKKKQIFDKLVEKTPANQRNVWNGKEACFGMVCQGSGKYIPPNANQNCNSSVNICIQDFDLSQIRDSTVTVSCDIKAGDPPSVSPPTASPPPPSSAPPPPPSSAPPAAGSSAPPVEGRSTDNKNYIIIGVVGFVCLLIVLILFSGGDEGYANNNNNYY